MGRYLYQISGRNYRFGGKSEKLLAMKKILRLTLPLILVLMGNLGVMAQTSVSGTIVANTVWSVANGPYTVTGDVLVASGATLTVEPGLEIRFDQGTKITVEGSLAALGTATDSIFLTSNALLPDTGSWMGIVVSGSVGGFVDLDFCHIEFASNALSISGNPTGNHIVLRNTLLKRNARALEGLSGNQTIRRCRFESNTIAVQNCALSLTRCAFYGNDLGVSNSASDIDSCTFSGQTVAAIGNTSGRVAHSLFVSNKVALKFHTGGTQDSILRCQFAENDTALVTAVSLPAFLDNELCANGVNIRVASGNNVSIGSNCWCDSAQIAASIIDGNSQQGLGILNYGAVGTDCGVIGQVWPGDTDDDGTARVRDLLHIGVANGTSGYPREGANAGWLGQAGLPWDQNFGTGLNLKHADCDGNGVVNLADTAAIIANYGQSHQKMQAHINSGGIPLYIEVPRTAQAGDTIDINLRLGDANYPATNVYGIAFSLAFDPTMFDLNSATATLQGTWLGQPGQNLIEMKVKDSKFNWAICRDDHQDTTGNGRLGGVTMVMIDDLTGVDPWEDAMEPFDVSLIDNKGNAIGIDVFIVPVYPGALPGLNLCPNPANGRMTILLDTLEAEEVAVYDGSGTRMFLEQGDLQGNRVIETSHYAPGIYFVQVRVKQGLLTRKVIITR